MLQAAFFSVSILSKNSPEVRKSPTFISFSNATLFSNMHKCAAAPLQHEFEINLI